MGYKLLSHADYQDARHPPLVELPEAGDHVTLVFQGLEGYRMTEPRTARVVEIDAEGGAVAELLESGMLVPVSAGERIRFTLEQAFTPSSFGDETIFGLDDTLFS